MRVQSQFIEMFGNTSKEMLGKFIQVIRGVSYKPSDVKTADDPDTAVILRSNNINDANLNTDEVVYIDKNRVSGDQYLRINDIVVCASNGSKALVGKAAINKTLTNQYAHGAFCLLVRPNDNINPVYLNTFFQTSLYKKQIDELAAGSNILNIKQEHLTNMILPLPIIEEQNKFAIIAEQADKSKFGGFKSQFIEMFGGCANRIKLSSLCSTFVDGDWIESKDQSELGVRLIQTGNVGNGFFKDKEDKSRYISEETFDNLHCTEIYHGDILVSRLPDPIGRACIIPQGLGRTITAVDCTIIRLKDIILPDYFIAYTMTPSYAAQINEVTTGTTRRRVSRANLGNILIPCPSIAKQQQFVAIAKQADKSKSYVRIALKSLESMLGYCIRQVA